jgi:hypothetical protein
MNAAIRIFCVAALALSLSAEAQFEPITRSYEVNIKNLRIPGTTGGTLAFKECRDCDLITIRVTPDTVYVIDGEAMSLPEFRREFVRSRRAGVEKPVIVAKRLATETVASVTVNL